ncbi:hypothetical protein Ocin01_09352 [Orchesella cincta]|uniref:Uncharacterized protein n=1 Tax=Orchesella cincta TaxID=48709 RepID=A0A1D2MWZ4_ORCCI|nr:hypothetical protein Ocin01_09352 [Orchesella cincta]
MDPTEFEDNPNQDTNFMKNLQRRYAWTQKRMNSIFFSAMSREMSTNTGVT